MSEAKWCDVGDHPFSIDAGMESISGTRRVRNDEDGTFKVVTVSGDACMPCSKRTNLFKRDDVMGTQAITAKQVDG